MPYQVTFTTVQIGLAPVVLLSAGEDANVSCGTVVNLLATVDILANLPGHGVFWEQLDGIPVILSSTDTLATSYAFTERSRKIFRVWIDKGQPNQQFADVTIFHTPTSDANTAFLNATLIHRGLPIADFVVCNTFTNSLEPFIPDTIPDNNDTTPCQPDGGPPTSGVDFEFTVSWIVPNQKTELVGLFKETELFYAATGLAVPNAIYTDPPGSTVVHRFFPGGENERKSYYVVTRYVVNEMITENPSCVVDYTDVPFPFIHVLIDPQQTAFSKGDLVLRKFSNSIQRVDSMTDGGILMIAPPTEITRFENKYTEAVPALTTTVLSNARINIVRFDPTGIGT